MFCEDHAMYTQLTTNPHFPSGLDKRPVIVAVLLITPIVYLCASFLSSDTHKQSPNKHLSLHRARLYQENLIEAPVGPYKDHAIKTELKLVCYYNFPDDQLEITEIDAKLCTHLNLAFATVSNNSVYLEPKQKVILRRVVDLKQLNPGLVVMLSVGGAGNTQGFPEMVSNHSNRKTFIRSIRTLLHEYALDGVDIDWEFPGETPANKHQRMHFTQLLEEFRKTINKLPVAHKFLLSVAVAAPPFIIQAAYDVPYINQFVDFINVMSYDYHFYTNLTPFTGLNAPLYAVEVDLVSTTNINFTTSYWMGLGMDKGKIIVGLPTYGHSFRLANSNNKGLYAPALGYGRLGSNGFVDFPQICTFLTKYKVSPIFDLDTKSPYASKGYEWISFDDEQSLSFKAEFIRDHNFGGAMVYALNSDDHRGICTGKKKRFPLISTVKDTLFPSNI